MAGWSCGTHNAISTALTSNLALLLRILGTTEISQFEAFFNDILRTNHANTCPFCPLFTPDILHNLLIQKY